MLKKNRETQQNCYKGGRVKDFLVDDRVVCRNYLGNEKWVVAVIV